MERAAEVTGPLLRMMPDDNGAREQPPIESLRKGHVWRSDTAHTLSEFCQGSPGICHELMHGREMTRCFGRHARLAKDGGILFSDTASYGSHPAGKRPSRGMTVRQLDKVAAAHFSLQYDF